MNRLAAWLPRASFIIAVLMLLGAIVVLLATLLEVNRKLEERTRINNTMIRTNLCLVSKFPRDAAHVELCYREGEKVFNIKLPRYGDAEGGDR